MALGKTDSFASREFRDQMIAAPLKPAEVTLTPDKTQEFRDQVVTERESWIIDNLDLRPGLSVEENARLVEPGLEFAPKGRTRTATGDRREPVERVMFKIPDPGRGPRVFGNSEATIRWIVTEESEGHEEGRKISKTRHPETRFLL